MKKRTRLEQVLKDSFDKNVRGIYNNKLNFEMYVGKDAKNLNWIIEATEQYARESVRHSLTELSKEIKAPEIVNDKNIKLI